MKKIASLFAALVLGAGVQFAAFAQSIAPDALIKSVTDDVIAIVRQDKAIQSSSPATPARPSISSKPRCCPISTSVT